MKLYLKEYREKNTDKIKQQMNKYYIKNIEKIKEWKKEYLKEYRKKNADKIKQQMKEYYINNIDKAKDYNRDYYLNNAEKIKKQIKKYSKTFKGKLIRKVNIHNRRLLTKGLSLAIIQQVYENNIKKYGTLTCYLCSKSIEFGQDSLEHIIPLSREGTNNINNLEIAHRNCNSSKGKKTLEGYKQCTKKK